MTSYSEMARERKKARSLYLELRALGLELHAKEKPADRTGYEIEIVGISSLSDAHADRLQRRVDESKLGLLRVLWARWDADLEAIRCEGSAKVKDG